MHIIQYNFGIQIGKISYSHLVIHLSKPAPRLKIDVVALPTGESVQRQISGIPVYHTDWTNVSLNVSSLFYRFVYQSCIV